MSLPTLSDWQVAIGAVTIGKGTPYLIHDFSFFGQSNHRTLDTPRGNRSGDFTSKDYFGSRVGTVKVTVTGATPEETLSNYNTLVGEWWVRDTETTRPLTFKMPGQVQQQMIGKPRRFNPDFSRLLSRVIPVDLEYYNPDPAIYAAAQSQASAALAVPVSGRPYPRVYPMAYGGGQSQVVSVSNSGNYRTKPAITITGPCTNPTIENLTQGKHITIAITLAADDFLTVDTDAHAILLNGTASRRYAMTSDSQWWDLDPGVSNLRLTASSGQVTAQIATTNLLPNPSAETNLANISGGGGTGSTNTLAQSSAAAYVGTYGVRNTITATGTAAGQSNTYATNTNGTAGPIVPGQTYTGSAYARFNVASTGVRCYIAWYNASGTFISNSIGTTVTLDANTWTRLTETDIAPANASRGVVAIQVPGRIATSGDILDTDAAQLEAQSSATPYCDGSQSGCSWDGTANASTSTRPGIPATAATVSFYPAWIG